MREFDTIEAFSGNRELYKTDSDSLSEKIISSPKPIPKTPKMGKSYPYKIKRPLSNSVKVDLRANSLGEKKRVISTYLEADIIVEEEEFDYSGTPRPNGETDNPLFDSHMYMTQNEAIIEEEDEIPYLASGDEEKLSMGSPLSKKGEIGREANVDIKIEDIGDTGDTGDDIYASGVETDVYRTLQEKNAPDKTGKVQNNTFFYVNSNTAEVNKKSLVENNLKDTADGSNNTKETDFSNEVKIMLQRKLSLERGDKTLNFVLFSWQKDFYDHLRSGSSEEEQRKGQLFRVLGGNWRSKFDKKGVIFFYFVIEWISYVKSTLVVKNISWNKIPGYRVSHFIVKRCL